MIEPNYDKSFERLPFEQAIEYLRDRVGITSDEWRQIYEQWRDYAFTVAGVTRAEVLQDLQDALVDVLAEGKSLEDWRKEFRAIAADRGWVAGQGLSPWRVELIFRQNTQTAYSAGRYTQQTHPDVIESRPYWMYRHGDSRNPRPAHKALDGKVYPAGDPFWATCYPTNGFGCRCKVITLSQRDLARRGLSVEQPPAESVVIRDRASGGMIRVPAVDGLPIAEGGFTTIPGANKLPFEDALNKMPPGLRALMERPRNIDFAAKKKGGVGKKNCTKGWSCGYSCISKSKNCRNALKGQSKTYADWLAKQSKPSQPKATAKPKAKQKTSASIGIDVPDRRLTHTDLSLEERQSFAAKDRAGVSKVRRLPRESIVSDEAKGVAAKRLDDALDSIPDAADRVARLRRFMDEQSVRAVFNPGPPPWDIDEKIGKKAGLAERQVMALGGDSGGYTSTFWNHVTISSRDIEYDEKQITKGLNQVSAAKNKPLKSKPFNGEGPERKDWKSNSLYIYLHEMGHQVDFKSAAVDAVDTRSPQIKKGEPYKGAPTRYAATNRHELFAESFALYMLDAKRFKQDYPDLHDWVDRKFTWITEPWTK